MAASRLINVSDIIDRQKISWFQIQVIILCGMVATLDGFDTQSIAFVAPLIAKDINVKIVEFGPIFGSGLIGLTIGALTIGPWADRFGRRPLIIVSTVAFGVFSLATVLSDSFSSLFIYRLLTGLGLGAAMPNIIALTSEYSPSRARSLLVSVMFVGFPLGAVVGGFISSLMIPVWGWQSVFYFGGALPIAFAVILLFALPESIRFMVTRDAKPEKIASTLKHIEPSYSYGSGDRFEIAEEKTVGLPVKHLFIDGRALGTVLLWIPFFMNLLLLFFMYNWLPPVLQAAGLPITRAIIATVIFNLGGVVGALILGRLCDRFGHYRVLAAAYAFGAVFVGVIGFLNFSIPFIMVAVFLAGFCTIGGQIAANALAAIFYPTSLRSTGVGWALGIGRIGSILGPVIGGIMLGLNFGLPALFLTASVPAVCATIAILLLSRVAPLSKTHSAVGTTSADIRG
jgi:AAHS family 4-hydroxybenzoate transporter-like MFS transporter